MPIEVLDYNDENYDKKRKGTRKFWDISLFEIKFK